MPRARSHTIDGFHDAYGEATLAWTPEHGDSSLGRYLVKHGVAHLLWTGRKDDAEEHMLDLHFMAEFADAWETLVEPLGAWRVVGLDRARAGYERVGQELGPPQQGDEPLAQAAGSVSNSLECFGLLQEASNLATWSMHVLERILGEEHPDVATSYGNIASVHDSLGDYPLALQFYEKSLAIRLKVLGEEHPYVATSYGNIGLVHDILGDYPLALEFHEKSLAITLKVLGEEHPDVATSYNNIGNVHKSLGDYPLALEFYEKSLAIKLKVLGEEHPSVANSYNNIGWARLFSSLQADASEDFTRCLSSWSDPTDWLHHWARLGLALCDVLEGASSEVAEAIINDLIEVLGEDHDRIAKARDNVAKVLAVCEAS